MSEAKTETKQWNPLDRSIPTRMRELRKAANDTAASFYKMIDAMTGVYDFNPRKAVAILNYIEGIMLDAEDFEDGEGQPLPDYDVTFDRRRIYLEGQFRYTTRAVYACGRGIRAHNEVPSIMYDKDYRNEDWLDKDGEWHYCEGCYVARRFEDQMWDEMDAVDEGARDRANRLERMADWIPVKGAMTMVRALREE